MKISIDLQDNSRDKRWTGNFLAEKADYEPIKDNNINEKEILKAGKKEVRKNNKGESVMNNFAALASLKDKFKQ